MNPIIGLKITLAQREYYRYTGVSAEAERRGVGTNSRDFTRLGSRERQRGQENHHAMAVEIPRRPSDAFRAPAPLTDCKKA